MRRRGFIATLLGAAAAAVLPRKSEADEKIVPKPKEIKFTNDWTSEIKSVEITLAGESFDIPFEKLQLPQGTKKSDD